MRGTGSGDTAHELLALDEAGDAAPPNIRNGTQECLGAGEGTGSGAASRAGILASPGRVGGRR